MRTMSENPTLPGGASDFVSAVAFCCWSICVRLAKFADSADELTSRCSTWPAEIGFTYTVKRPTQSDAGHFDDALTLHSCLNISLTSHLLLIQLRDAAARRRQLDRRHYLLVRFRGRVLGAQLSLPFAVLVPGDLGEAVVEIVRDVGSRPTPRFVLLLWFTDFLNQPPFVRCRDHRSVCRRSSPSDRRRASRRE